MRWILVGCMLLATTSTVISSHRPKRDLSYIKNLILSKLFGEDTIIIQQPQIPKNETYQLFKIKGYDNVLLKIIQKPKKDEKVQDPVIVSPDVAIIGTYLGTTTQGETIFAIETAKNLLKSGILSGERDKFIQTIAVPYTDQIPYKHYIAQTLENSENVLKHPVYISPSQTFPATYPALVQTSGIKYEPVHTKYSYTQKGVNADMKYESYNNKDVIVTRTVKEPPLPQYIKIRLADVASIGTKTVVTKSQRPVEVIAEDHITQPIYKAPNVYDYLNPSILVSGSMQQAASIPSYIMGQIPTVNAVPLGIVESGQVLANHLNSPVLTAPKPSAVSMPLSIPSYINARPPFDIREHYTDEDRDKINKFINRKLNESKLTRISTENVIKNNEKGLNNDEENKSEASNNNKSNNVIVSQYLYKQMNRESQDNYTVVKVGIPPKINHEDSTVNDNESVDDITKGFIFVPPENIDVPPPNMIPKTNNNHVNEANNGKPFITSKTEKNNEKRNTSNKDEDVPKKIESLKEDPIVVLDEQSDQRKTPVKTFTRRKSNFRPYTGGPVF